MAKFATKILPYVVAFVFMFGLVTLTEWLNESNLLGPILVVVLSVVALVGVYASVKNAGLYIDVQQNQDIDVSADHLPLPIGLNEFAGVLAALGFCRLGESTIRTTTEEDFGTVWCFVSADKQIVVETVWMNNRAALEFTTAFADQAVVETMYPIGENINRSNYRSHHVTTSIQDAYQHHLEQVQDFSTLHGSPTSFQDMAQYLEHSQVFRQRYGRIKLRRPALQIVAFPVFFGGMALLILLMTLLERSASSNYIVPLLIVGLSLLFMLMPLLLPTTPRTARRTRLALLLLIILAPASLTYPVAGLLYLLGLIGILALYLRQNAQIERMAANRSQGKV